MLDLRTEGNMLLYGIMYNRIFYDFKNVHNWTCLVILRIIILILRIMYVLVRRTGTDVIEPRARRRYPFLRTNVRINILKRV